MNEAAILKEQSWLVAALLEVKTESLGFWEEEHILVDILSSVDYIKAGCCDESLVKYRGIRWELEVFKHGRTNDELQAVKHGPELT